jgi:formate dehydrogenase major subunit
MTGRTPNTVLQATDVLEIGQEDAEHYGLRDGDCVNVRSRYGEAQLPIRIDARLRPGEVFTTFHTRAAFINRITGPYRDSTTHTPEYKVTAVQLERIGATRTENVPVSAGDPNSGASVVGHSGVFRARPM